MVRRAQAYRLCMGLFFLTGALTILGAGYSGWAFTESPNDQVLIQMVFYGAWAALVGAWIGGYAGARMEEDACGHLDMGCLSCSGAFFGALAGGLIGTAAPGLALEHGWIPLLVATLGLTCAHAAVAYFVPLDIRRRPGVNHRGFLTRPDGTLLAEREQPLRMKERVSLLMTLAAALLLGLTLVMALMMGGNLGHPAMMAPMMYGMFGTMAGGMLGGWLAGVVDEHQGDPEHDNPIMVSAMALMAGMMGAMPAGMIGGMMAVMGVKAITLTIASGAAFGAVFGILFAWGRYAIVLRDEQAGVRIADCCESVPLGALSVVPAMEGAMAIVGGSSLRVQGLRCEGCVATITSGLGGLEGVLCVEVDVGAGRVTVQWGDGFAGMDVVRERLRSLGYQPA